MRYTSTYEIVAGYVRQHRRSLTMVHQNRTGEYVEEEAHSNDVCVHTACDTGQHRAVNYARMCIMEAAMSATSVKMDGRMMCAADRV